MDISWVLSTSLCVDSLDLSFINSANYLLSTPYENKHHLGLVLGTNVLFTFFFFLAVSWGYGCSWARIKPTPQEFLLWCSGLRIWHCLLQQAWVTAEVQVLSLAGCSELRSRCCCSCGIGHSCGSDSIPGLGSSICCRCGQRNKQNPSSDNTDSLPAKPPGNSELFTF